MSFHYGRENSKTRAARLAAKLRGDQQGFMQAVDEAITSLATEVDRLRREVAELRSAGAFRRVGR